MQDSEPSRRKILSGIATAGTAGAVFGTGTTALFSDDESVQDGLLEAGGIDLLVEWETDGESGSSEGDATIPIEFSGRDPDRTGSAIFSVSLPEGENNPAYGWLRTTCPGASDLAEALEVTLRYDCEGDDVIASGSLLDVADALRNGVVLSPECEAGVEPGEQSCLRPGEPVDLELEWELDEDYAGEESTSVTLEFVGRQCRNRDGTTRPFGTVEPCGDLTTLENGDLHGVSYVRIFAHLDGECTEVGKLELDEGYADCERTDGIGDSYIEEGRYDLFEDDDCVDTGYDVRVTDTEEKTEDGSTETVGLEFELLEEGADGGPDLCAVEIKGGSGTVVYDDAEDFDGNATEEILEAPEK